jgi:hypothetical protein
MEKPILSEEINSMKYLLGYKRGVVISEQTPPVVNQDEDNSLNPKIVAGAEQQSTTTPTAPVTPPSSTTPSTPPTVTTINVGVKNPSITELQNSLNTKFQSGLTPDGMYGPKTAASILTVLQKLTGNDSETPTNTTTGDQPFDAIKKTAEANANTPNTTQTKTTPEVAVANNFSEVDDINNI